MKRILSLFVISIFAMCSMAQQIKLWHDGEVVYQSPYSFIDSITFDLNTPVDPEDPEIIPEGYVKILIQVPDGEECNGIYMKGTLDGLEWSGENTYVGLYDANASKENAIRFQRVAENSDFFSALFRLGSNGLQGAICQAFPNDGSWQGLSRRVKLIADMTTLEGAASLELPQFHIPAGTAPGVLALKIGGWENSECVPVNEAGQAIFTMRSLKALPEGTLVGITGRNFEGRYNWDHENPIIMTKTGTNQWQAIANVNADCVYKYVIRFADEPNWADRHGQIIDGDRSDLIMPLNLQPEDEVEDWIDFDIHYPQYFEFIPSEHIFGLVGTFNSWNAPDIIFSYVENDGEYYVCEANNVSFTQGDEFRIRENESWDNGSIGWTQIVGDADNFEYADGNFRVKSNATYPKVTFKFIWCGTNISSTELIFTR